MSITEQDIKALTPEHRIVWKEPEGPREVEMGLWLDNGDLRTDAGLVVRWKGGESEVYVRSRIVRIIEPAFVPRRGLVIGKPGYPGSRLVCTDETYWLGFAPAIDYATHWFTNDEARDLIEDHGWKVVDDLTRGASNE